jgi:hypothetical protein
MPTEGLRRVYSHYYTCSAREAALQAARASALDVAREAKLRPTSSAESSALVRGLVGVVVLAGAGAWTGSWEWVGHGGGSGVAHLH